MITGRGQGNQILNTTFNQDLFSERLNYLFSKAFQAGVIYTSISFTAKTITVNDLSMLIRSANNNDILVKVDITEAFTKTKVSPTDNRLVARFDWLKEKINPVIFSFCEDTQVGADDVVICGFTLNDNGDITALDYSVQTIARNTSITTTTSFPLVTRLDGFEVGNSGGQIPISNSTLNTDLNAEMVGGYASTDFIYTLPKTTSSGTVETIPEFIDVDAVEAGTGAFADTLDGYKIQPQDGTTAPSGAEVIPVANNTIQPNLNAEMVGYKTISEVSKQPHSHNLDTIEDSISGVSGYTGATYFRVTGAKAGLLTSGSIVDGSSGSAIDYTKIDKIAYDVTTKNHYSPIYCTGTMSLSGTAASGTAFGRTINNARVFLQQTRGSGYSYAGESGYEKRTAYISAVTTTGFSAVQFPEIEWVGGSGYSNIAANDTGFKTYQYFVIGEA